MSFQAIRWAFAQALDHASTKFLLVALADCVNSEGAEMECWPSYAHLARKTGLNAKTVESGIYKLKQDRFIVDTGRRAGDTGKVVVYRLNDPKNGVIQPGPQFGQPTQSANGTRPQNTPENGVVTSSIQGSVIPPNLAVNPPKNGDQSPQKVELIPPKTGSVSRNGTSNGTKKESGTAVAVSAIDGVPDLLFREWVAVRNDKRAKTLTKTAVDALVREAGKAGMTVEEGVRLCVERNWISLNAGWDGVKAIRNGKHTGFAATDYTEGLKDGQPVA